MVEKLIEQLRKIDINNCAEKLLNEAREMKTIDEAEAFLKDNLNGEHLDLTIKILHEELFDELERMESFGVFEKDIDDETEPYTDSEFLLCSIIQKCKEKEIRHVKNVLAMLGVSEAGQKYVIKEIKKIKRENYRKEEAEKLKLSSEHDIEK